MVRRPATHDVHRVGDDWLERAGIDTALVSPLDDVRAEIKRAKPDLIIITGDLTDAQLADLARSSFRASAAPEEDKRRWLGEIDDWETMTP